MILWTVTIHGKHYIFTLISMYLLWDCLLNKGSIQPFLVFDLNIKLRNT